jgi:putative toxin-antitoxin system antitoxin component (TIGR02293 family)
MVVAQALADAGLEGRLPMPSPLQWYEAPLTERMELVRRGVPANWLLESQHALALTRNALCELLGLKVSTVNRKLLNRSLLNPDESERLMGLQRLIGQVEVLVRDCGDGSTFEAGRWLADWLQRPNRALGGVRPAAFMDTAEGREQVGRLIGAQRSGSYM